MVQQGLHGQCGERCWDTPRTLPDAVAGQSFQDLPRRGKKRVLSTLPAGIPRLSGGRTALMRRYKEFLSEKRAGKSDAAGYNAPALNHKAVSEVPAVINCLPAN